MRARFRRLVVPLGMAACIAAVSAGCAGAAQPGAPSGAGEQPVPVPDTRTNGRAVCLAVTKTSKTYLGNILEINGTELTAETQKWAENISKQARDAQDTPLRAALLSLADVVRGWAANPPDRAAVRGYQNDLDVVCRPYVVNSPAAS